MPNIDYKCIGIGAAHIPSLTFAEASCLRVLWSAGKPLRAWDVYDALAITDPGTFKCTMKRGSIALVLINMVKKGLLHETKENTRSNTRAIRSLYYPTRDQQTVVTDFCDVVSLILTGKERNREVDDDTAFGTIVPKEKE